MDPFEWLSLVHMGFGRAYINLLAEMLSLWLSAVQPHAPFMNQLSLCWARQMSSTSMYSDLLQTHMKSENKQKANGGTGAWSFLRIEDPKPGRLTLLLPNQWASNGTITININII